MDTYIGTVLYFGVTRLRNVAYLCNCLAPPTSQHCPATVASLLAMLAMATQIGAELAGWFVFFKNLATRWEKMIARHSFSESLCLLQQFRGNCKVQGSSTKAGLISGAILDCSTSLKAIVERIFILFCDKNSVFTNLLH